MNIAVIGWGSLIWSPETLALRSRWRKDGPLLPIEFARISRDGRLTLVILPSGQEVRTYWALSAHQGLNKARQNLADREGSKLQDIHYVSVDDGRSRAVPSDVGSGILEWLILNDGQLQAAMWTGLTSNWQEKRGCSFTLNDAICYLREIEDTDLNQFERARSYICKAPSQIQTPVRAALQRGLGWDDIAIDAEAFEVDS